MPEWRRSSSVHSESARARRWTCRFRRRSSEPSRVPAVAAVKLPTMGGGLPLQEVERPLGTRTIVIPIGNHDNNQHSFDENLQDPESLGWDRADGRPARNVRKLVALVVLLRGVNVGGHRTFRPTTLAQQLKHLDAVNIGAAGTFVIRKPVSREQLRAEFARRLPFDTHIMICQGSDIVRLMSRDFFANQEVRPDIVRFVSVLSQSPRSAPSTPIVLSCERQMAVEDSRAGEPVRCGAVSAPHEGHRLSRHAGPDLWGTGHHAQLEYHHRDSQGAG